MNQFDVEKFNTNLPANIKVFVPNKSGHDFSDAKRYGELVYVSKGIIDRFSLGYMARLWAKSLKDSSPKDYILVTCMSHFMSIGCGLFGHLHGRLNLLIYRNNRYIAREMSFAELLAAFDNDNEEEKGGSSEQ